MPVLDFCCTPCFWCLTIFKWAATEPNIALWYRLRQSAGPRGRLSDLTLGGMPKMSQHIQHHHPQHPQYVHYTGPPGTQFHVIHRDTTRQPPLQLQQPVQSEQQQVQQAAGSTSTTPVSSATTQTSAIVATGDWTQNLVHLAKTAELKYVSIRLCFTTCLSSSCDCWSMFGVFLIRWVKQESDCSCFSYFSLSDLRTDFLSENMPWISSYIRLISYRHA